MPLAGPLEFSVQNESASVRTETLRVSLPIAEGLVEQAELDGLVVDGFSTAWMPLQLWADGTVKVVQAQFTDTLTASQSKSYAIEAGTALSAAFSQHAWVAAGIGSLEIGAEVRDTFDVAYRATLVASAAGTVVQETSLLRCKKHRVYHTASSGGIGRDYLASTFYVYEFKDSPVLIVDWVPGNDYLGADAPAGSPDPNIYPLGPVDVNDLHFLVKGATTVAPYRATQEAISAAEAMSGSFTGYRVLQDDYIGDGQTKRYRMFVLLVAGGADPAAAAAAATTLEAMRSYPLWPMASRATWADAKALGLMGGPITGGTDAATIAAAELATFEGTAHFGAWGNRSDPLNTEETGTVRNWPALTGPLAHALQGNLPGLLVKLEQQAWAQSMRCYHLHALDCADDHNLVLWHGMPWLAAPTEFETLGRRAMQASDPYSAYRTRTGSGALHDRNHGWPGFDHEHFTLDLVFDYWTVTGDAWAYEELRQLGESLKGLMSLDQVTPAFTGSMQAARAEGWCMQAFAQVYQATRSAALKSYAVRRLDEIIEPQRHDDHASKSLAWQADDVRTGFAQPHEFYMPWQHGAVLWAFLGAYKAFDEPVFLTLAEEVATAVEYAWVTNAIGHANATILFVAEGLRYYVPTSYNGSPVAANYFDNDGVSAFPPHPGHPHFGDSPLGGAHQLLTASLFHLADLTANPTVAATAIYYGSLLRGNPESINRAERWLYCLPQAYSGDQPYAVGALAGIVLSPPTGTAATRRGVQASGEIGSITLGSLGGTAVTGAPGASGVEKRIPVRAPARIVAVRSSPTSGVVADASSRVGLINAGGP